MTQITQMKKASDGQAVFLYFFICVICVINVIRYAWAANGAGRAVGVDGPTASRVKVDLSTTNQGPSR
jgi:hypothetical protein